MSPLFATSLNSVLPIITDLSKCSSLIAASAILVASTASAPNLALSTEASVIPVLVIFVSAIYFSLYFVLIFFIFVTSLLTNSSR